MSFNMGGEAIMSDELNAIAHRFKYGPYCEWTTGSGGPGSSWYRDPQCDRDAFALANAYIAHLDSESDRDLPITREWLESIGFNNGDHLAIKDEFMLSMDGYRLAIHVEGDDAYGAIYALHLPHITTRGQVFDLLRVLGVKP